VHRFARHPEIGGIAAQYPGGPPVEAPPTTHALTTLPPAWVVDALEPCSEESS
jgi:hypothetical protein